MGISQHHIDLNSIVSELIKDGEVKEKDLGDKEITLAKLKPSSIQRGSVSVSFPFAAAGVENVTADITFPTSFDAAPTIVLINCSVIDIQVAVTAKTATGFTVTARDSEGTDYTAALSATIDYLAIE